ncbi:PAPA-1-like conserved region-domain-containing protein [Lentinula edodes]|nr:PAPA-1-like conserved region-domain-containing protein [Lentinula edodes]
MTTRQAVLASVMDSSHIALGNTSKKKKVLNETELALRREENARKRKNLSEKRLEDEKLETINRLLKKQSRPRTKRAGGPSQAHSAGSSVPPAPVISSSTGNRGEMADAGNVPVQQQPSVEPDKTTLSPSPNDDALAPVSVVESPSQERRVQFSLAIPAAFLPPENSAPLPLTEIRPPAICAVSGCGDPRKYRLVKDWKIGACGMAHLKVLEGMS